MTYFIDEEINEDVLAIQLLYSLPGSYKYFRCAIESRDELQLISVIKNRSLNLANRT